MARPSGKPAAPAKKVRLGMNRGSDVKKVVDLVGTPIKFVSVGPTFVCPRCSATLRSGIVMRHDGVDYCSRNCARIARDTAAAEAAAAAAAAEAAATN